ncbi:MAG: hypothetical protein ABEK17_05165 [Candidatus Aenigmatarchaeota archaeon]
MILRVLGFIDILMGFVLLLNIRFSLPYDILFWLGIILLFKAGYSILTSLSVGSFFDLMGYLDFAVSIILIVLSMSFVIPINVVLVFSFLILIKGTYTSIA